jgi:peptide/nickel transport system substrate-binding protein
MGKAKIWFSFLMVVVILSLLLTACGSKTATTTTTSSPAVTTPSATLPAGTTPAGTAPAATTAPATTKPAGTTPAVTTPAGTTAPATISPQYGGTLSIIVTGGVAAIGTMGAPQESVGGMYGRVSLPTMESLWTYDAAEKFIPKLAESWDIAPDGKTLTINLRKGIKFQDGTPFNAQAVAENLKVTKESPQNPAFGASLFANVTSWDVLDANTIRVNFKAWDSNFMVTMANRGMASAVAMQKTTTAENQAKDHTIGTGPFNFVSYQRGQYIKYAKFSDYWMPGKPYLDGINLNQVDDSVTAVISFKKGEAQLIFGISPKNAAELEKAGYQILKTSANLVNPIVPDGNNADSPFSVAKVRQAVEYAIDKKSIASIGQGYWAAATQMAAPSDARFVSGLTPRDYNPAKAKQLLAEAGFPNGFSTKLIANSTYNNDVLVAIQTYLGEAGIKGTIEVQDPAKFADTQKNGWKNGILFSGTPIVGNLQSMWNRFGPSQYPTMYKGKLLDVLAAANSEPDYTKRMDGLKNMVKMMHEEAMVIPVWLSNDLSAQDPKLKGDILWTIGHPNMWEPQNAWLSK